jgi:hypothetical protein
LRLNISPFGFGLVFLKFAGNSGAFRRGGAGRKQTGDELGNGASKSFHRVETYA